MLPVFPCRLLIVVLMLTTYSEVIIAQCGTIQRPFHFDASLIKDADERGGGPRILPVVFHVHHSETTFPIQPEAIIGALEQCNAELRAQNENISEVHPAFSSVIGDFNVELRLARRDEEGNCISGILYHAYSNNSQVSQIALRSLNSTRYLNIHIIPSTSSWGTLPGNVLTDDPMDVILFSTADAQFHWSALSHEVGHYLGLYHTFGLTNISGVSCGDDFIADTPVTKGSPAFSCNQNLSECTVGVIENVDNHMDYSGCRKMFTMGQAQKINAVLDDATVNRYALWQSSNLSMTGVFEEPECELEVDMWHRSFADCDSTRIEFFAMAEGQIPDYTEWYFEGASQEISHAQRTDAFYHQEGDYMVRLVMCFGNDCDTAYRTINIGINNALANGLPLMQVEHYSEDFENNFSLPTENMFAVEDGTTTWQLCDFAGYNSEHCIYVPAEVLAANDTCDLVLGNFDMSSLNEPTFSFKVATSMHTFSYWSILELHFRDLCSSAFVGNVWGIWQLYEMNNGNDDVSFTPTEDGQWMELSITRPEWTMAQNAEFVLRLIKSPTSTMHTPEAFFLDDINIASAAGVGVKEDFYMETSMQVYPNPADDFTTVQLNGNEGAYTLRITDMTGRVMMEEKGNRNTFGITTSQWPAGVYAIHILSKNGEVNKKLVVR